MKILNKKCGIVWGAALAATAMATTVFLCPASATAATATGPTFGDLKVSYTHGPHQKLKSKNPARWTDIEVQHLYLSTQAKTPAGQKSGASGWGKHRHHIWDSSKDLYGPSEIKLKALPIPTQGNRPMITHSCNDPSTCTLVGTKDGGQTYDLLSSFVTGMQLGESVDPLIAERLPVTLQDHFYEFESRDAGSSHIMLSESAVQNKRLNPLGLLPLLGVTFKDWKKDFSEQNKNDAATLALKDLKVLITKTGGTAAAKHDDVAAKGFYAGKTGVYRVTLEANSSADKDKDVPFGKHASLTVTAVMGNPREDARKALWGKLKQVQGRINDKSLNLSAEKREALKKEAHDKADEADKAVKEADFMKIEEEKTKGVEGLENVALKAELMNAKVIAKSSLQAEKDRAESALTGLTDDMAAGKKADARERIRKAYAEALSKIEAAKTPDEAISAGKKGEAAIKAIVDELIAQSEADLAKAKEQASQRVKDAQKTARSIIAGLEGFDESEHATRLKEIDAKVTSALEAINAASTSTEAYKHADKGVEDINDLLLFIFKVWGRATVLVYGGENGQARKDLNALLKPGGGLTQLQIDGYVKQIQALVSDATRDGGLIDLATSVHDVLKAVKQAKSDIDGIVSEAQRASSDALKILEQAKTEAEVELRQIADGAKSKVSKIAGVGQGEKDAANAKINAALKQALTAVDQADTVDDVRKAVDDGRNAIEKILMDLENLAKKHGKPATDKPAVDKSAADKPAALAATGVAVTDMVLFVALLAMLAAVGVAVTRRRR